jgi:hypothetical protein
MNTVYRKFAQAVALSAFIAVCFHGSRLYGAERDNPKPAMQDRIVVIGHLPLTDTSVSGIDTSGRWERNYLELNDDIDKKITLVDVTDPAHPVIVRELTAPEQYGEPTVESMVGNVALVADAPAARPATPKSVAILDFSDPSHPITERTFEKVTALKKAAGGLIYLVDSGGLWILKQYSAPDSKLEAAYKQYVLYGSR